MSGKAFWIIFILLYVTVLFPAGFGLLAWRFKSLREMFSVDNVYLGRFLFVAALLMVLALILAIGMPLYPPVGD